MVQENPSSSAPGPPPLASPLSTDSHPRLCRQLNKQLPAKLDYMPFRKALADHCLHPVNPSSWSPTSLCSTKSLLLWLKMHLGVVNPPGPQGPWMWRISSPIPDRLNQNPHLTVTSRWDHTRVFLCLVLSCVQLFATPWTVALQAPLSMRFSRQEYWNGLPCPPPGDLSNPRVKPRSPALQVDSLPSEPPGKTPDDAYAY